jgi:hypothetical protein
VDVVMSITCNIKAMVAIETGTFKLGYYANCGLKVRRLSFQLAS